MKYSKALDILIAAQHFGLKGDRKKAFALFEKALKQKDLKPALAALEALQASSFKKMEASLKQPARSKVKANDADIFNDTMDEMSEEADLDDVLEMPVADGGESEFDTDGDDAMDLDFSPSEEFSSEDDLDLSDDLEGLDDLGDLSDEDFGEEDFGSDSFDVEEFASTTGEGDLEDREAVIEDNADTPEGEPAKDIGDPDEAEDTTVVSKLKSSKVSHLNLVHANLAALRAQKKLTTAARVAVKIPKK